MDTSTNTSEIVESTEELDSGLEVNEKGGKHYMPNAEPRYSIEDDINRLFQAIDIRTPVRISGQFREAGRDALRKSALKRPIRVGSPQLSGIGISEPVSLKQALRGLCISQAAEMAATKRLSRSGGSPGVSEAGTIKRLYRAVVVEAKGPGVSVNEGKRNVVEISLIPERTTSNSSIEMPEPVQKPVTKPNPRAHTSKTLDVAFIQEVTTTRLTTKDASCSALSEFGNGKPKEVRQLMSGESSSTTHSNLKDPTVDDTISSSIRVSSKSSMPDKDYKDLLPSLSPLTNLEIGVKPIKSICYSPRSIKPIFSAKNFVKKKAKLEPSSPNISNSPTGNVGTDIDPSKNKFEKHTHVCAPNNERREKDRDSSVSGSTNISLAVNASILDSDSSRPGISSNSRTRTIMTNSDERSRSRDKGEFSQSSKSSMADYSSSPSFSGESILSGSSRSGNRPHMSKDLRWEAIHHVQNQHKNLGLRDFKVMKRLGIGDIGTVYLAELSDTNCLFALKVMDNEFLASGKKMLRAQTERDILQMLDHPFLPTLYAHVETDKLSCLVIDYCPGGDLHVLRQKQPCRNFSEQAVRFYVAEVLLALEYLHMLGVVYRDLKPENILVREDGHIMLTDFDLSLRCAVHSMLLKSSSPVVEPTKKILSPCSESSCIDPFCLQPSWHVPCFTPRILSAASKTRKIKSDPAAQVSPLPQLVVEPTSARSNSFVGTHEYLAPEIIKGEGHGSAVDWWTYGIFLFELLYGKTPFKGSSGNDETLSNIVSQSLRFPDSPLVSFHARDLIRGLLIKDPENRLGSAKGAAEIKQHPFFDGLNWALIRCAVPPELPKFPDVDLFKKDRSKRKEFEITGEDGANFELF